MNTRLGDCVESGLPRVLLPVALLLMTPLSAPWPAEFYVSPSGDNAWSGSLPEPNPDRTDGPFATLGRAKDSVRGLVAGGLNVPVEVIIRDGTYYVPGGIELGPEDSGTPDYGITWKAFEGESPVLIGGMVIDDWKHDRDRDIWTASIPEGVSPRQLFENGRRLRLARTPNAGYLGIVGPVEEKGQEAFYFDTEGFDPADWDYSAGSVFIWPGHNWFSYTKPIANIDADNHTLTMGNAHGYEMRPGDRYFVQNIPELLDLPGECVIDRDRGTLLCKPHEAPIEPGEMVISTAENVIRIAGEGPGGMVRNLRLEALTITIANGDAVLITNAEACRVSKCSIENAYSRGVVLNGDARSCAVLASRVAFHGWHGIDISGPGLGDRPGSSGNSVVNNHIHHCGRLVGHGYGVAISQSSRNWISNNHIHHMPRYGVTIKGTCFSGAARVVGGATFEARVAKALIHSRNNRIASNHIHHVNLDSQDTGAIEAWGPGIGNVIENNVIHDVGNPHFDLISGIYLDDSASYFTVTDNVIWGIRGTHGNQCIYTKGIGNIIQNNVLVCSPEGVRGIRSFEMANELARAHHYNNNIFLFEGDERVLYRFDNWSDDRVASSDYNLFAGGDGFPRTTGAPGDGSWEAWRDLLGGKFDAHSVTADPLFVDPENHDYRLRSNSPALTLGIRSIDTTYAGVMGMFFQPGPSLSSRLEMVEDPSAGIDPRPGRVRLTVQNVGTAPAEGKVAVEVHPPGAAVINPDRRIEYSLRGGEEREFEFQILPGESVQELMLMTLPDHRWLDPVYLPVRPRIAIRIPRIGGVDAAGNLGPLLADAAGYDAFSAPHEIGVVKAAVSGDFLAIEVDVNDTKVSRAANPWEASCVEVFVSPDGKGDIRQVFLLPETAELPPEARLGLVEGIPVIEGAGLAMERKKNGYILRAMIPLQLLGLSRDMADFYFEAAVIARPEGADQYLRDTLFGGPSAYNDASGYARVRVGKE